MIKGKDFGRIGGVYDPGNLTDNRLVAETGAKWKFTIQTITGFLSGLFLSFLLTVFSW